MDYKMVYDSRCYYKVISVEYRPLLMIPGPSDPYPEAVETASKRFLPHYSKLWLEIYSDVISKLKKLFGGDDEIILFPGPATGAVELALNSILNRGDYIVFIGRGFFVDRFKHIAEIYGGKIINIASDKLGKRIDIRELEYLFKNLRPKAVFLVHSETSVGVLEDINLISNVIPDDTFFIVDAVSIFGAIEYKFKRWRIDVCIGYSSKALGALPGVVPVMISERLWSNIRSRDGYKGFINDIRVWREYADKWKNHPYPVSLPTQVIMSIKGAADRILDEGIKNVEKRHYRVSKLSREYGENLGFKPLPDDGVETPTVSVFLLDNKLKADEIARRLLYENDIMISTTWLIGLNGLRIGHMGYTANEELVLRTFKALETIINKSSI